MIFKDIWRKQQRPSLHCFTHASWGEAISVGEKYCFLWYCPHRKWVGENAHGMEQIALPLPWNAFFFFLEPTFRLGPLGRCFILINSEEFFLFWKPPRTGKLEFYSLFSCWTELHKQIQHTQQLRQNLGLALGGDVCDRLSVSSRLLRSGGSSPTENGIVLRTLCCE